MSYSSPSFVSRASTSASVDMDERMIPFFHCTTSRLGCCRLARWLCCLRTEEFHEQGCPELSCYVCCPDATRGQRAGLSTAEPPGHHGSGDGFQARRWRAHLLRRAVLLPDRTDHIFRSQRDDAGGYLSGHRRLYKRH